MNCSCPSSLLWFIIQQLSEGVGFVSTHARAKETSQPCCVWTFTFDPQSLQLQVCFYVLDGHKAVWLSALFQGILCAVFFISTALTAPSCHQQYLHSSGIWALNLKDFSRSPHVPLCCKQLLPRSQTAAAKKQLIVVCFMYMINFNLLFYCSAELCKSRVTSQDLPSSCLSQAFPLQIVSQPVSTYPSPLRRTRTAAGKKGSSFKMF